jgi:hypothetical protein
MIAFGAKEVIIELKILKSENETFRDYEIQSFIDKGEEIINFINK